MLQVWELFSKSAFLKSRLSFDLQELKVDKLVVDGHSSKFRQHMSSFFLSVMVDEPSRAVRHEQHSSKKNDRWGELQADRDKPCSFRLCSTSTTNVVGPAMNRVSWVWPAQYSRMAY